MSECPTFAERLLHLVSRRAAKDYAATLLAEGAERKRQQLRAEWGDAVWAARHGGKMHASPAAHAAALSVDLDKARAEIRRLESEVESLQARQYDSMALHKLRTEVEDRDVRIEAIGAKVERVQKLLAQAATEAAEAMEL